MAELPHHWREYARLQFALTNKKTIDCHAWGLEAGLDCFLATPGSATAADVGRAISTAARRERSQRKQRHVYLAPALDHPAISEPQILARSDLIHLANSINEKRLQLVLDVAAGTAYEDLAPSLNSTPATLRVSVHRTRTAAATLLRHAA